MPIDRNLTDASTAGRHDPSVILFSRRDDRVKVQIIAHSVVRWTPYTGHCYSSPPSPQHLTPGLPHPQHPVLKNVDSANPTG